MVLLKNPNFLAFNRQREEPLKVLLTPIQEIQDTRQKIWNND